VGLVDDEHGAVCRCDGLWTAGSPGGGDGGDRELRADPAANLGV